MSTKQSSDTYQLRREAFLSVITTRDLARLLKTEVQQLQLLAYRPQYRAFSVPKKNGGQREIEAPVAYLKKLQRRLNRYLQAVYYFDRTPAAYGFIISSTHELDCRNIVTNAFKHRGRLHLLNLDLEDFFHTITDKQVTEVFSSPPFSFRPQVAQLLCGITTCDGRLPVGAPTSPVLSNFVCRALDEALQTLAQRYSWVYTRYVDDLSVSSHEAFTTEQFDTIESVIALAGFSINTNKVKLFGPEEEKIVTGLVVGKKKIKLVDGYLDLVGEEIDKLDDIMRVQNEFGVIGTAWVDHYKQQIRGRLSFIRFSLGPQHPRYIDLKTAFHTAIAPPPEEFGAVSWRGIHYF